MFMCSLLFPALLASMFGSKPTFTLGQSETAGLSSRISAPQTSFF